MMRTGSIYIAVLMACLLVSTIAVSAMWAANRVVRLEREESNGRTSQLLADSAMEWALAKINSDANWRTTYTNAVECAPVALQGSSISFKLVDVDGSLSDDVFDTVNITVTAKLSNAVHAWTATLEPAGAGASGLGYSIAAKRSVSLLSGASWSTSERVGANVNISTVAAGAYLTANCEASGTISGNIVGTNGKPAATVEVPGTSALDPYKSKATIIELTSLPLQSSERVLSKVLLSANDNTLTNKLNRLGIYWIDCAGSALRIRDCRIQATLVVTNASSVTVSGGMVWDGPKGNYPLLVSDSPIKLAVTRTGVEEVFLNVNLNPSTTPYRGQSDSTPTSSYPSQLRGLVFSSSSIQIDATADFDLIGHLMANEVSGSGTLLVHPRSVFSSNPPPGFRRGPAMILSPGTLRRVATP